MSLEQIKRRALTRDQEILLAIVNAVNNSAATLAANLATEITLGDVNVNLNDVENLLKGTGGTQRTPSYSRVTGSGTVALGKFKVSFYNIGTEIGQVLGTDLGPDESITFEVRDADTLGAIAYDPTTPGTGTTFAITTIE